MYQFRLQRVLDYRHQRTTSLERELHEMVQRLQQEEASLERCRAEVHAHADCLNRWEGKVILSDDLRMVHRAYCDSLDRIEQQEIVAQQSASNVATKRQELVRAKQEEQALEKLKEKGSRRDAAERATHEQRILDELIISRGYDGLDG